MKKGVVVALLAATVSVNQAQERSEEASTKCNQNHSLFYEYARNGNYADALEPWEALYNDCPELSKNIYKYGVEIIKWQIEKENDAAKKQELVDKLMALYDNRITYFGTDPTLPAPRILGYKAYDAIGLSKKDPLHKEAYAWLGQAIDELKTTADPVFLQYYILLSKNIYEKEPAHADQFINDFIKADEILTEIANDESNKLAPTYAQVKAANESVFLLSKVADCEKLDDIYKKKVADNKSDIDLLTGIAELYRKVSCVKSNVFFAAAEPAFKANPTEEMAVSCATYLIEKKEYSKAVSYLEQATQLAVSTKNKAAFQLHIASIYSSNLNNFSKAREAARNSLEFEPNQCKPYILIGSLYARSSSQFSDPVIAKTVYWAAVDKFARAKQAGADCTDEANGYINQYSRYFPADNEMFMHPDLEKGKSYTVGGWIGESTICR